MKKNGLIYFMLLWIESICNVACLCDTQIPNGDITSPCDRQNCHYSCHEGYQKHDTWPGIIACSTHGQWVSTFSDPQVSAKDLCTPKPCPTVISKGAFSATCKAVVGSTCSFSCEAGYMRNTSVSELTCQTSTEWSPDLRSLCLRPDEQQCPYYIPRGDLSLACIREPGQTCNFTCDKGYQPSVSPSKITCGSDLEWNHNPESLCQEIFCSKYFEGGCIAETCSRKYNTTCYEVQCDPGYFNWAGYVRCHESGKWVVPVWNISACITCDMQIPHGDVWCPRQEPICYLSCHKGYQTQNRWPYWIECSTSGQWVDLSSRVSAKDLCSPRSCPTVISKGAFSATCKAVVGSTCSFSCEAGYMRNTSVSELTCQTSTEWSQDLRSLCLRLDGQQCPYYIPRGDLNLACIRKPGQTCNFTCNNGYQPTISPSMIACGSNLEWNHNPESLCQGIFNLPKSTGERNSDGNVGTIVGTTVGALIGLLIIIFFVRWIAKRSSVRKSQRRVPSHVGGACWRPRETSDQNVTTLQQHSNAADGIDSVSSFESPSYNGLYVHSFVPQIPTISSSCKYSEPPPSYSETQIATNESPPTYEEAIMDPYILNLYI